MTASFPPARATTRFGAIVARPVRRICFQWARVLTGPHRHAAVVASLAIYTVSWTLYRCIATYPRNIHFDMSELYAWSLAPAWGYEKHPPLSAFIVRLWFDLFPKEDWAFTLLAAVNVAVSLYLAWLILERWTNPAKAAFGLAMLVVIPFYNFLGLKYNANTVLLPVWAFAAYSFLRAYEDLSDGWSVLAGVAAGAAMLGKYWSVFLVAGLLLTSVLDVRRVRFFSSRAPYLMVAAGAVTILPHVLWILDHNDALAYVAMRASQSISTINSFKYVVGTIAYASAALSIWALLLRPDRAAIGDIVLPDAPQRRATLYALVLPNALPVVVAMWRSIELTPLWAMPGYALLPLALLSSDLIKVSRRALAWAIALAASVTIAALLLSPLIAMTIHLTAIPRPTDYAWKLADDVTERWHLSTAEPVPTVFSCGPDTDLAMAVAWDLRAPTRKLFGRTGISARAELLERGGIIVGAADDPECLEQAAIAGLRPRTEILSRTYQPPLFGIPGRPVSYFAAIVPPP